MIEVKPGNPNELIIHHNAISNFPKKAIVKIPLVVRENSKTTIDRLLDMNVHDTLDLDISNDISDYTMEINEADKNAYVIRFTNALPIRKKNNFKKNRDEKSSRGNCVLSEKQGTDLNLAVEHANNNGEHTHISGNDFSSAMTEWLSNTENRQTIVGAAGEGSDTTTTNLLNSLSDGTGEMECFPNEGKVFNKKFHIVYDSTNEFINDSNRFEHDKGDKFIPHKNAINDAVNELKSDIERLGGIYVSEADYSDVADISGHIIQDKITDNADNNNGKIFFDKNTDIDILITYKYAVTNGKNKLRKLHEEGKPEGEVREVRQVRDAIFVSYKNGNDVIPMNAVKFAREYLSKDYSRYTHISINGYLTGTQNQSIYFTMMLIVTILGTAFLYNAVPSFYKTAIRKDNER